MFRPARSSVSSRKPRNKMAESRPCLLCQKQIEHDENFGYENLAVRATVEAGYGSLHDTSVLDFVICDDCIDACLAENLILEVDGRSASEYPKYKDTKHGQEDSSQSA